MKESDRIIFSNPRPCFVKQKYPPEAPGFKAWFHRFANDEDAIVEKESGEVVTVAAGWIQFLDPVKLPEAGQN